MLTHCLKLLSVPSPSQLCQSQRTPVELQRISPSGNSHFRTIERQDSFDMGLRPVISCGRVGSVTVVRPQPRTHSLDLGGYAMQTSPLFNERNSHIAHSTPSDLSKPCASSVKTGVDSRQTLESKSGDKKKRDSSSSVSLFNGNDSLGSKESTVSVEHVSTVTDAVSTISGVSVIKPDKKQKEIEDSENCTVTIRSPNSTESSNLQEQGASSKQGEQGSTSSAPVSEGDSGIDPCAEAGEEDGGPAVMDGDGSSGGPLTNKTSPKAEVGEEGLANSSEASSQVEQQGKKKGCFFLI